MKTYPIINWKKNALAISTDSDHAYSFDHSGRLFYAFHNRRSFRRGLDNRVMEKRTKPSPGEIKERIYLMSSERDQVIDEIYAISVRAIGEVVSGAGQLLLHGPGTRQEVLERLKKIFDQLSSRELVKSGQEFCRIYSKVGILPPDRYLSLLVQLTQGCHWNQCTFCDFYQDVSFGVRTFDEICSHLSELKTFFGPGISQRRGIFLGGANALLVSTKTLLELSSVLHKHFPEQSDFGIFSFLDLFTGAKKNRSEWGQLREVGFKRAYVGVETGHAPLMKLSGKQGDPTSVLNTLTRIKQAGLDLGIIFMVGLGGDIYQDCHRRDSIELVKSLPLGKGDLIFLSKLRVHPELSYYKQVVRGEVSVMEEPALSQELARFREELKKVLPSAVKVARYEVEEFIY